MEIVSNITQAVTAADFKRAIHFVEEDVSEDATFDGLLLAAQAVVEAGTNRPLTTRTAQLRCRSGCGLRWWLPCAPVSEVTKIEWLDTGTWQELPLDGVWLEQSFDEPQLVLPSGFWVGVSDGADIRITAEIGHAAAPKPLAQAIILVASDWYEAGINAEKTSETQVSFGARALMKQARYARPCEWAAG